MPDFRLTTVDVVIVVVYFAAVMAHGLWVSRGKESSRDYFLAGRSLGWFLIGFSLFASNMSGASFVGLMGASYTRTGSTAPPEEQTRDTVFRFSDLRWGLSPSGDVDSCPHLYSDVRVQAVGLLLLTGAVIVAFW